MIQNKWSRIIYTIQKENYEKFDIILKKYEKYRTTNINMVKYFTIMFADSKLMELPVKQQNQVDLYLFNSIN